MKELTMDNCISCLTKLISHVDNDPDGSENVVCAKCHAEEKHDFDLEPNARFDRFGGVHYQACSGSVEYL